MKKLSNLKLALCGLLLSAGSLSAFADIIATGTVLDDTGDYLVGATVAVKGQAGVGTATDVDGNFTLKVPDNSTLTISYIGYVTRELPASASMGEIVLQPDDNSLDEVIVIGYGTVKRKDLTTAVSTVGEEALANRPIISAAQAIQGKAPGVAVQMPTGAPGSGMTVRVRGTSSFNGSNEPLYVVDGVPVDNINFLSPSDIENMQILKDASSAAIYGSRGANGVVIITTKQGKSKNAKVSVGIQAGWTQVAKKMDVLNTAEYYELLSDLKANGGNAVTLPAGLTDQTDWFNETYRTGNTQTYEVSLSQSTDKMSYYLSGGYQRENGILKSSFFQRFNFRANVEGQIRSWLKAKANILYSDYSSNGGGAMGTVGNRGGVILAVINTPTYAPIWDPENPERYYNNFYGLNMQSPLENEARAAANRSRENRILASGELFFDIIKGLTFSSKFTMDRRNGWDTSFLDPETTTYGREQGGTGYDGRNQNTVLTWDNVANYNFEVKKSSWGIMAGSSWTDSNYCNSWINGQYYRNGSIQTLNAANMISWTGTGTGGSTWGIMSVFGRITYNYDSRYLVTANIRYDGSSKLHPDHRWKAFPSISAAWRISQEKWFEDSSWLSDLKLRAGWGKTGNQDGIGDYAYLQRYNINRVPWFEDGNSTAVPTISQANLRTKDLTWETTTQWGIGVDFGVLNNRIELQADWYYKKTSDMLMWVSLPSGAAAASSIQRNEGEMVNKGFEFGITSQNFVGEFTWTTNLNMSFNRNKLTKLELQKVYLDAVTSENVNEAVVRNEPGRSMSNFYGYVAQGIDPETGLMIYKDLNGDGKINASDRTFIGDPNPDFTFGFTNDFSWKGFTLTIFFQGSSGNDIFNASRMETEGMYDSKNQSAKVLNRWRIPGQITDMPRANWNMRNSTYFVEDGSYIRLKDVTLAYDFTFPCLKKIGITRLQPYFTASNLVTFTHYSGMDPEVNQWGGSGAVQGIDWGTYPHCKSYVFGVNIDF
ncbi:MAG: TonB-dependent receptor [Muribaculaceae bacterium]|nr:TonB-dependent receptor [Muribaculaceae bacterium]